MRYEIKSIGIWAFIKISFFLSLVIGFIFGLFYAAFFSMILAVGSAGPYGDIADFPFEPGAVGPVLLIILPIGFAIGGAVINTLLGVISIVVYNLIARLTGGLEFELQSVTSAAPVSGVPTLPPPQPEPQRFAPPPPPPSPAVAPPEPEGPPASPPSSAWTPPPPPPDEGDRSADAGSEKP